MRSHFSARWFASHPHRTRPPTVVNAVQCAVSLVSGVLVRPAALRTVPRAHASSAARRSQRRGEGDCAQQHQHMRTASARARHSATIIDAQRLTARRSAGIRPLRSGAVQSRRDSLPPLRASSTAPHLHLLAWIATTSLLCSAPPASMSQPFPGSAAAASGDSHKAHRTRQAGTKFEKKKQKDKTKRDITQQHKNPRVRSTRTHARTLSDDRSAQLCAEAGSCSLCAVVLCRAGLRCQLCSLRRQGWSSYRRSGSQEAACARAEPRA